MFREPRLADLLPAAMKGKIVVSKRQAVHRGKPVQIHD